MTDYLTPPLPSEVHAMADFRDAVESLIADAPNHVDGRPDPLDSLVWLTRCTAAHDVKAEAIAIVERWLTPEERTTWYTLTLAQALAQTDANANELSALQVEPFMDSVEVAA